MPLPDPQAAGPAIRLDEDGTPMPVPEQTDDSSEPEASGAEATFAAELIDPTTGADMVNAGLTGWFGQDKGLTDPERAMLIQTWDIKVSRKVSFRWVITSIVGSRVIAVVWRRWMRDPAERILSRLTRWLAGDDPEPQIEAQEEEREVDAGQAEPQRAPPAPWALPEWAPKDWESQPEDRQRELVAAWQQSHVAVEGG